jgi:hypothetical protein
MSLLPTVTNTYTKTSGTVSIAEAFTETVTRYTTSTSISTVTWSLTATEISADNPVSTSTVSADSPYATDQVIIQELVDIDVSLDVPLTCENIRYYWSRYYNDRPMQHDGDWPWNGANVIYYSPRFDELGPNPDIAGIGVSSDNSMIHSHEVSMLTCEQILLAFLVTACSVVLLAFAAYAGGFLPAHFLRRVDKRIFRANYRNQHSKWRHIIESVMISLSDQQLVTGFAILIAGYYEMMNSSLSIYHWRVVTYLAWLSSSVHIASLTLLRDVLNKNPTFRNLRVAGMLLLLSLLLIALWPTRFGEDPEFSSSAFQEFTSARIPAKCFWTSIYSTPFDSTDTLDANWVLSVIMLLFAYVWKLSQLQGLGTAMASREARSDDGAFDATRRQKRPVEVADMASLQVLDRLLHDSRGLRGVCGIVRRNYPLPLYDTAIWNHGHFQYSLDCGRRCHRWRKKAYLRSASATVLASLANHAGLRACVWYV